MIAKRLRASKRGALVLSASAVTLLIAICNVSPARALDEQSGEAKAIDACEKQLCTMLLTKSATGGDLKCQLDQDLAAVDHQGGGEHRRQMGLRRRPLLGRSEHHACRHRFRHDRREVHL